MSEEQAKYSVYSIRRLPAGVWGESYVVIAAYESDQNEYTSEVFVLTKRPEEALNNGSFTIISSPLPPELGVIDLEFALQEGFHQTEIILMEMLEARANELNRPDVAYMQYELKPTGTGDLLSCWMRRQYISQLNEIKSITNCNPLKRYLGLLSQVSFTMRAG